MKAKLLNIWILFFVTSCTKEEVKENNCHCGKIVDKYTIVNNKHYFQIKVRNECTNKVRTFDIVNSQLNTLFIGDNYCGTYKW